MNDLNGRAYESVDYFRLYLEKRCEKYFVYIRVKGNNQSLTSIYISIFSFFTLHPRKIQVSS